MIFRNHEKDGVYSFAWYSKDEKYRYILGREWGKPTGNRVTFIMLNPSTATELENDPTVERCQRRARDMGFEGFIVANLFALRSTDPNGLYGSADPVGPKNDMGILMSCMGSRMVVCAWGTHGALLDRGIQVKDLLISRGVECHHLGLTKDGHPRHPLYLSYKVTPQRWSLAS